MAVTAAAAPAPVGVAAAELTRPGTTTSTSTSAPSGTRPRTPIPGFLLDRGRVTRVDAPAAVTETGPNSINNRGQVAGSTLVPTEEDPLAGARGHLREPRCHVRPQAISLASMRVVRSGDLVAVVSDLPEDL
jgi:hypothetical protein